MLQESRWNDRFFAGAWLLGIRLFLFVAFLFRFGLLFQGGIAGGGQVVIHTVFLVTAFVVDVVVLSFVCFVISIAGKVVVGDGHLSAFWHSVRTIYP